jgi:hypothetical protein
MQLSMTPSAEQNNNLDLSMNMPDNVQNSLDTILQYYRKNTMRPRVDLKGDPLDITSGLVTKVQETLPQNLQKDGKILLDFMVREIVSFCREHKVKSLSLNFVFESGAQ